MPDADLILFATTRGHVVSMTIDWQPDPAESVGTCQCGWVHREPRKAPFLAYAQAMDKAVEAHWRERRTAEAA